MFELPVAAGSALAEIEGPAIGSLRSVQITCAYLSYWITVLVPTRHSAQKIKLDLEMAMT
jgi:hypothetical protein